MAVNYLVDQAQGRIGVDMSVNKGTVTVVIARHNDNLLSHPLPLPPQIVPIAVRRRAINYATALQGLVSVAVSTAVAPIERVHLLIQNQNELIKSGRLSTPYKGMRDCFRQTIKQEGITSLWRGNSVNILKVFTSQALAFAIYKNSWYRVAKNDDYGNFKFHAAVISATLIQYPLDYARTRLANDVKAARGFQFSLDSAQKNLRKDFGTRKYTGMLDVCKQTLKTEGMRGLYRGYNPSFLGVLVWDSARYKIMKTRKVTKEQTFLAKYIPIAMVCSLPVALYPITCVSRRMMMNSGEATTRYKNSMHAFGEIVKHEGFCSLYKGVTAGMTLCFARLLAIKASNNLVLHLLH